MIRRVCPYCLGNAYSASDDLVWTCPYCGEPMENALNEVSLDPALGPKGMYKLNRSTKIIWIDKYKRNRVKKT